MQIFMDIFSFFITEYLYHLEYYKNNKMFKRFILEVFQEN